MGEPEHGPDGLDRAIRLGCGGLFGLLVGVPTALYAFGMSGLAWSVAVAVVLLCALLALRYGDRFWTWVMENRRWWYP